MSLLREYTFEIYVHYANFNHQLGKIRCTILIQEINPPLESTSKNTLCNKQQFELFYIVGNYLFFMNIDFHFSLRTVKKNTFILCVRLLLADCREFMMRISDDYKAPT